MEISIQDVARVTGTTSRTLRHYDDIGLLAPARIGSNGYRHYDQESMIRLQRILLLRELGLSLPVIADVLSQHTDTGAALRSHVEWLREDQARIDRQIASIQRTLSSMDDGKDAPMERMFDGFDHAEHRKEVERRWGANAYATGANWWESKDSADRAAFRRDLDALNQDWIELATSGANPQSPEAQELAARHVAWLSAIPGTPASDPQGRKAYVTGLATMYVADPRFAANYGGSAGAQFVRDCLEQYAADRL